MTGLTYGHAEELTFVKAWAPCLVYGRNLINTGSLLTLSVVIMQVYDVSQIYPEERDHILEAI